MQLEQFDKQFCPRVALTRMDDLKAYKSIKLEPQEHQIDLNQVWFNNDELKLEDPPKFSETRDFTSLFQGDPHSEEISHHIDPDIELSQSDDANVEESFDSDSSLLELSVGTKDQNCAKKRRKTGRPTVLDRKTNGECPYCGSFIQHPGHYLIHVRSF
jgi:hypothetical protein